MEKPAIYMMKKPLISDMGMAITGIRVVRQFLQER